MGGPGPQLVNVRDHIDVLFALDSKIAEASPDLLPLGSPHELLAFLTVEHESDTYLWRGAAGELVGYLSVIDFPDRSVVEVLNVGVDPDAQGEGHGKAMMDYAERLAREASRHKLTLVTNVKNAQARRFYEGIGFTAVSEAENYYGDGETRVVFEKAVRY
jgi:ribosomal protein S18 acetylase RimI-like enzyme